MNFRDFINEGVRDTEWKKKIDLEKSGGQIAINYDDRNIALWIGYKTIQSNKKLVLATWFLVIGTLILSGLTIYLQYFK